MTPGYVWRFTDQGAVAHVVRSDGTNRAVGASLCGRTVPSVWRYGPHFGSRLRCGPCQRVLLSAGDKAEAPLDE